MNGNVISIVALLGEEGRIAACFEAPAINAVSQNTWRFTSRRHWPENLVSHIINVEKVRSSYVVAQSLTNTCSRNHVEAGSPRPDTVRQC